MKPLHPNKTTELLKRIDNSIDGELRHVTMNSPTNFTVELSVQDKNRGYDWINIVFEVDGISDARLLDDEKVSMVDMSEGITVIVEETRVGLAIGSYKYITSLTDATLYLVGTTLKYEERPFSD